MPNKPTKDLSWASAPPPENLVTEPLAGVRAAGWSYAMQPPYNWINWLWQGIGEWQQYLGLGPFRFDRTAQATDQGVASGGYLLQAAVSGGSGQVGHRTYVGTGLSHQSYVRTVNAVWDVNADGGPRWAKDQVAEPAYAWMHDQNGIRYFSRGENDDTPWTDGGWNLLWFCTSEGNAYGPPRTIYRVYPAAHALSVAGAWAFTQPNQWSATAGTSRLVVPLVGLPHGALLQTVFVSVRAFDRAEATVEVALYEKNTPFDNGAGTQLGATVGPTADNTVQELSITANQGTGSTSMYYLVLTIDQPGSVSPVDYFGCRVALQTGYNQF